MKNKNIIIKIAELFLENEESSIDWKKDKKLMYSWQFFFISIIVFTIFAFLGYILNPQLITSPELTASYRIVRIFLLILMIFAHIILTLHYYRFIIKSPSKIYFVKIIQFYLISILLFGFAYAALHAYDSTNFVSTINLPEHSETYVNYGLRGYLITFKFHLYSALQSVTGNFSGIKSNSIVVSIFNYLQNIYTLALLTLLISTFVNRNSIEH